MTILAADRSVPVRDAATVVLVRGSAFGPEVCMLRRHPGAVFLGGYWVFPGGAVEPSDHVVAADPQVCLGRSEAEASAVLGRPAGGAGFWWAAVRECYEESGLLPGARAASGAADTLGAPGLTALRDTARREQLSLHELCRRHDLVVGLDQIHYLSRWRTPHGPPRRYDTRFFLALAPEQHELVPDGREVVEACWITPAEALERSRHGQFDLIEPTLRTLEALAPMASVDEMLRWVQALDAQTRPGEQP